MPTARSRRLGSKPAANRARLRAWSAPSESPPSPSRRRGAPAATAGAELDARVAGVVDRRGDRRRDGQCAARALERDEVRRTRWFCYVSFAINRRSPFSLFGLHGDPAALSLMLIAIAASGFAIIFTCIAHGSAAEYRRRSTALAGS